MTAGKPGRQSGPRIRTLKPELWADERFVGVSLDARLFYVGLITQADDEGRQSANPALLRARILPFDEPNFETIAGWLAELEAAALIQRWEVRGRAYLALSSWADDQRVDRPTPSKIPGPLGESSVDPREESREIENARDNSSITPAGPDPTRPGSGPGPDHHEQARDADEDRPEVVRLCDLLAELMVGNDPKAKVAPDSKRWRDAARLLIDTDGRTAEQIEVVIRFTQADRFERTNVLSMPKLRDRFGSLWLKAQEASVSVNGHAGLSDAEYRELVLK